MAADFTASPQRVRTLGAGDAHDRSHAVLVSRPALARSVLGSAIGAAIVVVAAFIATGAVGGRTAPYLVHPFALWSLGALAVKRLHDQDRSAWWLLVALIPIVGPLWLAITLVLRAGTPGDNRISADPRMRDTDYLVVA